MQLETVTVLGGVVAVGAPVLVDGGVRLHVRVQHGLVDARIAAVRALERLRPEVVTQVILQVVLVFGDKRALGAGQQFLWLDVTLAVHPEVLLGDCDVLALLTLEGFDFALGIDPGNANTLFIFHLFRG